MTKLRKRQYSEEFWQKLARLLLAGILTAFPQPSVLLAQDVEQSGLKDFSDRDCKEVFSAGPLSDLRETGLLDPADMSYVLTEEHPLDRKRPLITPEDKQALSNKTGFVSGHLAQREDSRTSVSKIYSKINAQAKQEGESLFARQLTEREAQALVNLTSPIWKHRAAYLRDNRQNTQPERANQNPLTEDQSWMLKQAGFSEREIGRILSLEAIEGGWSRFFSDLEAPQMALAKRIQEGKPLSPGEDILIFVSGLENYVARVVKFDGPGKIIIEFPNPETGDLSKMTIDDMTVNETREGRASIYEKVSDLDWRNDEKFTQSIYAETKLFSKKYGGIKAFDLEAGQIFSAYRSDRKILSMEELNLQAGISVEPDFSKSRARHPEIQEQIAFARAIRRLAKPPHPHNTHIEWLALKIPSRIEYVRDILIRDQEFFVSDIQQNLSAIKEFENQALSAIQQKKVSYVWWLAFNYNLAALVSRGGIKSRREILKDSAVARVVAHFPYRLTLPITVWHGELKQKDLNMAVLNDVRPVAFSSNDGKEVKEIGYSYDFMDHDFFHLEIADDPFDETNYDRISPLSVFRDLGYHQFVKTSGLLERWTERAKPYHRRHHQPFVFDLLGVYD